MAGEYAPYPARVLDLRFPNFQILEGNSLAVEHPIDVMVRLHKELCRVRKGLVACEPRCHGVSMGADDRQVPDLFVE